MLLFLNSFRIRKICILIVSLIFFTSIFSINSISSSAANEELVLTASNSQMLKQSIFNSIIAKESIITIKYIATWEKDKVSFFKHIQDIINMAQSELSPDLLWNIKSTSFKISGKLGNAKITLNIEYLTTIEQDIYVNECIDIIASNIMTSQMSKMEKTKAIHDYIINSIQYEDTGLISHTAYSALVNGTAVCQGYSILAYKLLEKCGIESQLIYGYVNNDPAKIHIWNSIKIGEEYKMLDVTMDDVLSNIDQSYSTTYFCVSEKTLINDGYVWIK